MIEVNQCPSFMCDSPLDTLIKKGLLVDTFRMLNLNFRRKNKYINFAKNEMQKRLQGYGRATVDSKEQTKMRKQKLKDKFEFTNLGDFEICYPLMHDLL